MARLLTREEIQCIDQKDRPEKDRSDRQRDRQARQRDTPWAYAFDKKTLEFRPGSEFRKLLRGISRKKRGTPMNIWKNRFEIQGQIAYSKCWPYLLARLLTRFLASPIFGQAVNSRKTMESNKDSEKNITIKEKH